MSELSYRAAYEKWLCDFANDTELVNELSALTDEKQIEDRFYTELSFGTAGMRGVLGYGTNRINRYVVRRATHGLANYILTDAEWTRRGVAIAYDSRHMSAEFAEETALALCAKGVKTYLYESLRPVPMLSFAVRHLHCIAGVVITASHNPPQYNGYKVYWEDGAQLSPEAAAGVTNHIRPLPYEGLATMDKEEAIASGLLTIIGKDVDDAYIEMIKGLSVCPELLAAEGKNLKIVYTPLHGSGNMPVRRMLDELGIKNVTVVKEQEAPDGAFPTVTAPNPEDPAAFKYAIPLADEVGASVVFGTDPDCDRMGVVVRDSEGVFHTLTGNQIGCLLLSHVLEQKKQRGELPANGAICKSIVSTNMARAIAAAYGLVCYDTLTGFKFIGEKIQQFEDQGNHTFLFGFEESYGFLSGTSVRDKDGVNASLLLCEAACVCMHEGITLYDRLQQLYARFGAYADRVTSRTLPGKDGVEKMRAMMVALRENPPAAFGDVKVTAVRDYQTGLRTENGKSEEMGLPESNVLYYELEGGSWLCVRPSGTEPKIKLYVSAHAEDMPKAEELAAYLLDKAGQALA